MERRELLTVLAATAVLTLAGCVDVPKPRGTLGTSPSPPASPEPVPDPVPSVSPSATPSPFPPVQKVALSGKKIFGLPGQGNLLAWTVDDGTSSEVVAAYAQFAKDSGVRLTFFLNGTYPSWTHNAPALRPLVDSGQVQLGNHTFSHPDLTKLSDAGIVRELKRNEDFIHNTYGVNPAPFYRPPYGSTTPHTEAVAASIGYTAPVMWYGSLADSGPVTPAQIVEFATNWFLPQHIVLGHANIDPVTKVYPQLLEILRERNLETVTLNDVFQV
jgi:peptidoglycan/xylan/chitin deacetylase (PgdA/CDA1 family)